MKVHILFVGSKFIYNNSLKEYVIRNIEKKVDYISSIHFFKENDNSLFLHLEKDLHSNSKIIIVTTKQNFSTISKLLCTVTSDNLVLKDGMLIPHKSSVFEKGSYQVKHQSSIINTLHVDEMERLPEILLEEHTSQAIIHIFEEDSESALLLLNPISQMYDVTIEITTVITGWLKVIIHSKKYGNISNFITSAKQLLEHKLITSSNIISYIIDVMAKNQKKITFAESCTGGLLGYYFTKNNGASKILDGSLVTYANHLKENWLAVDGKVLEEFGAVSDEVVEQMSEGALNVSDADYAIAVSGIAGEAGGTKSKPVGLVYIAICSNYEAICLKCLFTGTRTNIKTKAATQALKLLLEFL